MTHSAVKSKPSISKAEDKETGKAPNGCIVPGVSMRMGPVQEMDVDHSQTNGINGKRKSRVNGASYKDASSASEDDDAPLSKKRKTSIRPKESDSDLSDAPLASKAGHTLKKPPKASPDQIGEESDDDVPLTTKLTQQKAQIEKRANQEAKKIRAEEQQKQKKKQRGISPASKVASKRVKKEESDDDEQPLKRKTSAKATSSKAAASTAKKDKGKAKVSLKASPHLSLGIHSFDQVALLWHSSRGI